MGYEEALKNLFKDANKYLDTYQKGKLKYLLTKSQEDKINYRQAEELQDFLKYCQEECRRHGDVLGDLGFGLMELGSLGLIARLSCEGK